MRILKAALIAGVTLASGGAMAQTFAPPPPPTVFEPAPPPPGPAAGFYLAPGYYSWVGGRYVWVPRRWIPRRVGYGRWVAPGWRVGPGGHWRFRDGHWAR